MKKRLSRKHVKENELFSRFCPENGTPKTGGSRRGPFWPILTISEQRSKREAYDQLVTSDGFWRVFLTFFAKRRVWSRAWPIKRVLDKKGTFSRSPKLVFWQCLFTCKKREKGSKTPPFGPANSTFTCNYEVNVFTESHEPKKDQKHPKNGFIKERPARPPSKNGQISSYSYT